MPSVVNNTILEEIKQEFETNPYAFISSFQGVSVADISELRRVLEKSAKRSVVVKHSLAKRAFSDLDLGDVEQYFKGNLLVTLGDAEPQEISKKLVEFSKTNANFVPCGVVYERAVYGEAYVKALADLPSRKDLLAQVVTRIQSPISGFVMTLNQMLRGLAVALNEIKKQKEAGSAAA